jgi:hypothetical protein
MMRNQTSVVDMLSAEQNRLGSAENPVVRTASQSRLSSTSYILIGATVALLVGTLTVGALFYFTRPAEEATATKNFFYPERTEMFDIAGKDRATLMRELVELREGVDVRVNFITEVKLVESVLLPTTNVTEVQAVTGERLLAALGTNAPATLTRALTPQTMLGIHEFGGNQPYLIFTTSDFENALSGMMRWEETLLEDLDPLFDTNQSGGTPETPPATSTAATSSASTTPARDMAISETFKDRTVGNIQVRAFEDGEGDIQLLWCMPDSATIIITTSTDTLTHVRKMMTAREY